MLPINDILVSSKERRYFYVNCSGNLAVGRLNRFSFDPVGLPVLLEEVMGIKQITEKQCYKCKEIKSVSKFGQYKSGKNKSYYRSYCKKCSNTSYRTLWRKSFERIKSRCVYDKGNNYLHRGIKCLITRKKLKELWFRDKAWLLKKPSLDRIDPLGNYEIGNCRYIELKDNLHRKRSRNNKYKHGERER
jgi:hypothetical protein